MFDRLLTAQREVTGGSAKYDAVLLVDGHFTVSSQVIETALWKTRKHRNNPYLKTYHGGYSSKWPTVQIIRVNHSNKTEVAFKAKLMLALFLPRHN